MRLRWTKTNTPLSRLIRFVTGQDCSHFELIFDSVKGGLVFESNLVGVHPKFLATAEKTSTMVHELTLNLSPEIEDKIWERVVNQYDGRDYDYLGVIYLGWRLILKRYFRRPMPDVNPWAQSGRYFCNELYEVLSDVPGLPKIPVEKGMKSPHDIWEALKNKY